MSNINAEMMASCASCGHSKIDHYASNSNESTEVGHCRIQDCVCQNFKLPTTWTNEKKSPPVQVTNVPKSPPVEMRNEPKSPPSEFKNLPKS